MAYRLAVFNVLAGNMDDHIKNFSFVMDGGWRLAPAYDLTMTNELREHTTSMLGVGLPAKAEFKKLALKFGIKNAEQINEQLRSALSKWDEMSRDLLPKQMVSDYALQLSKLDRRVFA